MMIAKYMTARKVAAATTLAATATGTTTYDWYMIEDYQALPVGKAFFFIGNKK